ncbi:MAG: glutathione S-transferase N-terminal domain-containing protein [Pseudomonadota bacterium]|nr:glutathione S-transferase N-terminal domain-containing protein [Pseudomonadota bacterium]
MDRLKLLGAPGSPYTRKMLALLRYRQIPYEMVWGGHQNPLPGLPEPKVKLLPTFYFPAENGALEAMVDSTPIIRRLEREKAERSVIPDNPVMAFIDALIEDFADEWLTKAMFHYRWAHQADRDNAGPLLVYWSMPTAPAAQAKQTSDFFTKRQVDRLYVVGSNETTAKTIEDSYARFVSILDKVIEPQGYVLGARPASCDFAIFGQLTQLGIIEPTSAAVTSGTSQRVRAWIDRMEDLSGLSPQDTDWLEPAAAKTRLAPLLEEIGRVYAPFLIGNAKAAMAGDADMHAEIDGRAWTQPVFPYQVKCLQALRTSRDALSRADRETVDSILNGSGCETLFQ